MPLEFPSQTASQTSSYINRINHYLQQKNDSYLILIGKGLIPKGYRSNSNPPNCGQMGSMYVGDACNFKLVVKYTMMLHSHKVQHNLILYSNLIFLYIFLCSVMQFSQFDIILAICYCEVQKKNQTMHACMDGCMYVCMYVCMCEFIYVRMHVSMSCISYPMCVSNGCNHDLSIHTIPASCVLEWLFRSDAYHNGSTCCIHIAF